ncbi:hypothetical protein [Herbidospora mongoliensis]|uniref:hypothetical protein n=1 Tax=Herbidospora mongoliensis TaxID=688067 RepID=UPI000833F294|nr:hypothetical protein [Herbidospora mongoliensis]
MRTTLRRLATATLPLAVFAVLSPAPAEARPAPDRQTAYYLVKAGKLNFLRQLALSGRATMIEPSLPRLVDEYKSIRIDGADLRTYLRKIDPRSPADPALDPLVANPDYQAALAEVRRLPTYPKLMRLLKRHVNR